VAWCYQYLGGIQQTATTPCSYLQGYKHIVLKPAFDIQNCEWANVSYDSPYGTIKSHWKKTLQHLEWDITVPCNTTADICLLTARQRPWALAAIISA
jgi:alpha-L-rhamnosidase